MSGLECENIGLDEYSSMITSGFEEHKWDIRVKWSLGTALFGREWNWFVEDAKVSVGDTLVLEATEESLKFKICVFEAAVLQKAVCSEGI